MKYGWLILFLLAIVSPILAEDVPVNGTNATSSTSGDFVATDTTMCTGGRCTKIDGSLITGTVTYIDIFNKVSKFEEYKDGKLNGVTTQFLVNGQIQSETTYLDGKKNGEYKLFDSKNRLLVKSSYKDDLLDGETFIYHQNIDYLKVSEHKIYTAGKLNGAYKSYYLTGLPHIEANFVDGKLDGDYTEYWDIERSLFGPNTYKMRMKFTAGKATEGVMIDIYGKETPLTKSQLYSFKSYIK